MPSIAYNTLLAVAQQAKLWITPARQTFAELPGLNQEMVAVPLWSEEFFTWCYAKFNFQNFPAPITYNKVLRTLDETAESQPREETQPANLRTAATKDGYHIDLGEATVHLTGKQWKITDRGSQLAPYGKRGIRFLRPTANRPLPHPTQSNTELHVHLRAAFGLNAVSVKEDDPAKALGQWLELALRPDTHCPPLILTGELRDEAAEAIRQLIDPVTCPLMPFPTGRNEAGWMALYNRVLAFQVLGKITEFKRGMITELSRGLFDARLRQTDHKGPKRYQQLGRPVILTVDQAPEVCPNQIVIEIHKCGPLPQQEVLAALFNQMVHSLRGEPKPRHISMEVDAAPALNSFVRLQADAPIP